MLLADVVEQPHHDRTVEVVATEVGVPVRRQDLEHAVLHSQDRDVERPAAEVIDGDHALADPLEPVGEGRRRRLVDDADDVESRDAPGVLGRLALTVVEVRRYRDDGLLDRLTEVGFGALFEGLEHDRRHLGRRDFVAPDQDLHDALARQHLEGEVAELLLDVLVAAAHQALHRIDGRLGPPDELSLRHGADEHSLAHERDDRRQERLPVAVRDDPRHPGLLVDVGDEAVGRPEINADDARHSSPVPPRAPRRCRRSPCVGTPVQPALP